MAVSASGRYFINDPQQLHRAEAHAELIESLTRINLYNPPVQTCSTGWTFNGLFKGPTSIAYLFYRLSSLYPDLVFKGQGLRDWAQAYLDVGLSVTKADVDSAHCGIANETLAQMALRAVIDQDASLAQQLCAYSKSVNSVDEEGSNEWLYGRAGYLYFLRLVRKDFQSAPQGNILSIIESAIETTISRILASPQPWTWHGKTYLGAAHGTIGIITQIVLSSPSTAPQLEDLLAQILTTMFPTGNFPSSLPAGSDELVQFCHGGPGFILSLHSLRPFFPNMSGRINSAISAAQGDVWNRGLLTKTPCLCHGIASNALVFDSEDKTEHFLAHMSSKMLEEKGWLKEAGRSDKFAGLYGGEAGRAWAWAVLEKHLGKTCIGFNDL